MSNIDNNPDGELTSKQQYLKIRRAMKIVFNVDMSEDEYLAILQLMNSVSVDTCLILDNSHENI